MSSSSASASAATSVQSVAPLHPREYKPAQTDINRVVFDFLVTEGFPRSADLFAKEANLQPRQRDRTVQIRMKIRQLIHAGDLAAAIAEINDISPQILDSNSSLHFALLRLQLIELIRKLINKDGVEFPDVVRFARNHVAPMATANPVFLKDLESAMSLTIINGIDKNKHPALMQHKDEILSPALRREIAARVNEALLLHHQRQPQSQLRELVRLRTKVEEDIRAKGKDVPDWDNLDVISSADDVEAMDTTGI